MDLNDHKEIWEKLKSVYIEVGHRVVYSILQELFYYPTIIKPKGYEKSVIQIFAEVKYLCKWLCMLMILSRDLWDTIAIIITLDL